MSEIRKISPESEEYSQIIESKKEFGDSKEVIHGRVFGSDVLKNIDTLRENGASKDEVKNELEKSKRELLSLFDKNDDSYFYAIWHRIFWGEAFRNQDFQNSFESERCSDYRIIANYFWDCPVPRKLDTQYVLVVS